MSDSEQVIKRFSMCTYLKDRQGYAGITPVYQSNPLIKRYYGKSGRV